ncbi:hypothetical protein GQR58_010377 [Nymphon striatum]|nr:hypothetical protein GQR58_010377 [Nymphon striatum]
MFITCVKSNETTNTVEDLKFTGILQNEPDYVTAPSGFLVPKYPIDTGYIGTQPFKFGHCYIGAQPFKFGRCTDTQLKQIELKQLRCLQGIGFDEARLTKQAQTSPFDAADSICSLISKLKQCDYIVDGITCLNKNEKEQVYAVTNTFVKVAEGLCANKMKNIWGLAIHGSKCLTENGMDFIKCVPRTKLGVEVFLRDVNNGFCK